MDNDFKASFKQSIVANVPKITSKYGHLRYSWTEIITKNETPDPETNTEEEKNKNIPVQSFGNQRFLGQGRRARSYRYPPTIVSLQLETWRGWHLIPQGITVE